ALQLALRAPPPRRLYLENRGHRPLALDRREHRGDRRGADLARPGLGRGAAGPGLSPDRALRDLHRARAAPARRRAGLLLRLLAGAPRSRTRGRPEAERGVPVLRAAPRPGAGRGGAAALASDPGPAGGARSEPRLPHRPPPP